MAKGYYRFAGTIRECLGVRASTPRWILAWDATYSRKLERGMDKVDSCDQSQHVELEAFVAAGDDAEQTPKRGLVARAARGVREDRKSVV